MTETSYNNPQLWEPFATWLHNWFRNEKKNSNGSTFLGLTFGILISPWSQGLFFLAIFIIVYEIFYYIFTKGDPRYYNVFVRAGVIYCWTYSLW